MWSRDSTIELVCEVGRCSLRVLGLEQGKLLLCETILGLEDKLVEILESVGVMIKLVVIEKKILF